MAPRTWDTFSPYKQTLRGYVVILFWAENVVLSCYSGPVYMEKSCPWSAGRSSYRTTSVWRLTRISQLLRKLPSYRCMCCISIDHGSRTNKRARIHFVMLTKNLKESRRWKIVTFFFLVFNQSWRK